MHFNDLTFYVD